MAVKRLLNYNEAKDLLNVGRTTLYRMIDDGDIATIKVKGSRRIEIQEIERYISEHRQCAAS